MNLKLKRCEYWMAAQKQMKRVVPLLLVIMPACSIAGMRFNPAFLSGDTEAVADLSRFEKGMTAFCFTRRNASHSGEGKKECEEKRCVFHVCFLK